jgi:hypothetical protein
MGADESVRRNQDGELFYEKEDKAHTELITDMQMSPDGTYFITSSKDKSAKVCFCASAAGRSRGQGLSLHSSFSVLRTDLVCRPRQERPW